MKKFFASIVFAAMAVSSFAGGLLTNTNQSAAFVRNPMRYASLETDAIYFNPAGTAFLNEGWSMSVNWQMIWQDRDVLSTTFLGQPNNKEYKGSVYVPCMPTIHAAYKKGDWTFSGFFGMPGGGGNAKFDNGLPLFDALGTSLVAANGLYGTSAFESTQYLFALQLGAAYKINDNLSVYGGLRTNYTSLSYEGAINAIHPQAGNQGEILALELTQTGIAFAPIIGVDYKIGKLNLGVKYEFRAVNIIENDTKKLSSQILASALGGDSNLDGKINMLAQATGNPTLGMLASLQDGEKFRNDAPALLTIGASYDITDRWKVMGGYTYYFDKDAKIESLLGKANTMRTLSRNTFEILGGVEFKATEKLLLSAGVQFSDFGVNSSYLSDVSFIDDSFTTGLGAKYSFNENLDLNVGLCYANYAHGKGVNASTFSESTYLRKTYNVAVGVDFRF
ncbi:MAG: outer membrane beta-barrel protein [Bacteroidaceae bacterium]|nr:outer membrane beta-barrel protein [Bacteroidaceae bacterium]